MLYVELHLAHEVSSPQAFRGLRERQLAIHRPERTVATLDHAVPALSGLAAAIDPPPGAASLVQQLIDNAREFDIEIFGTAGTRCAYASGKPR